MVYVVDVLCVNWPLFSCTNLFIVLDNDCNIIIIIIIIIIIVNSIISNNY